MNAETVERRFGTFDFGLSPDEEARAAKLHAESIVIDMLYWGPCAYRSVTPAMEKELIDLFEETRDGDLTTGRGVYQAQSYAIRGKFPEFKECWDASGITAGNRTVEFSSWELCVAGFGLNEAMFDRLPWVIKALGPDDIRRAKAEGKHAAWINTQLATGINRNFIDLLEPAHALGLRMVMLTYNLWNLIGAGCTERTDAGISNYGAKVIERMNELGIIVDTGHCGHQTTLDACQLSRAPVVASHTAAREVYYHPRAKGDDELKALADTGGIIGVYNMPFFIAPPPEPGKKVGMNEWLDQIDYIVNLVGWEHVGIGSDWPMPMPKSIIKEIFIQFGIRAGFRPDKDRVEEALTNLDGFDDYRDFPNVTRGLVKRGYRDEQIKGILGENFLRVFKEVCG